MKSRSSNIDQYILQVFQLKDTSFNLDFTRKGIGPLWIDAESECVWIFPNKINKYNTEIERRNIFMYDFFFST